MKKENLENGAADNDEVLSFVLLADTDKNGIFTIEPMEIDSIHFALFVSETDYEMALFKIDQHGKIVFQRGSDIPYDTVPEQLRVSLKSRKEGFGCISDMMIELLLRRHYSLDSETIKGEIERVSREIEVMESGSGAGRIINEYRLCVEKLKKLQQEVDKEKASPKKNKDK